MGLCTVLKSCLKGENTNITKNDLKFKRFVEKRIKREKEVGCKHYLFSASSLSEDPPDWQI